MKNKLRIWLFKLKQWYYWTFYRKVSSIKPTDSILLFNKSTGIEPYYQKEYKYERKSNIRI